MRDHFYPGFMFLMPYFAPNGCETIAPNEWANLAFCLSHLSLFFWWNLHILPLSFFPRNRFLYPPLFAFCVVSWVFFSLLLLSFKKQSILSGAHSFICCSFVLLCATVAWYCQFPTNKYEANVNILDMFHLIWCHSVDRFHILARNYRVAMRWQLFVTLIKTKQQPNEKRGWKKHKRWIQLTIVDSKFVRDLGFVLTSALSSHVCNFSPLCEKRYCKI